jgi:pimeloyl-ACP methyl ester carboxylesterase
LGLRFCIFGKKKMIKKTIQKYFSACLFIVFLILFCSSYSNNISDLSTQNINDMKDTLNMKKVTSKDGTTIAFRKSGSGPPLLLIHGTTADHRRWSGILPALEQHFSVYSMDRRGRGESSDSPGYDIMREAGDVATVLEHIGEPAFVLGHSYGAVCALEGALLSDKIRRLILYEPPIPTGVPMYPGNLPDRMQALIDRDSLEAGLELFMREVVRMPEPELKAYRQLPMWKVRIKIAPTIPRELAIDRSYQFDPNRFTHYQVPILLLLGGDSPDLFRRAVEVLDSALTNSTVITLPGQQHVAMDTNPELFMREVLQFLLK